MPVHYASGCATARKALTSKLALCPHRVCVCGGGAGLFPGDADPNVGLCARLPLCQNCTLQNCSPLQLQLQDRLSTKTERQDPSGAWTRAIPPPSPAIPPPAPNGKVFGREGGGGFPLPLSWAPLNKTCHREPKGQGQGQGQALPSALPETQAATAAPPSCIEGGGCRPWPSHL